MLTAAPARARSTASTTSLSIAATRRIGAPPFANVRSCVESTTARWQARSVWPRISSSGPAGSTCSLARSMLAWTTVRKLLKSWAMPPARTPSDSSLRACSNSVSACSRWLISGPQTLRDLLEFGRPLLDTGLQLRIHRVGVALGLLQLVDELLVLEAQVQRGGDRAMNPQSWRRAPPP